MENVNVETKVCKVCGKEKSVSEFNSKGKGYYDSKCTLCGWFERNKNYTIKDGWTIDEYIIIIDNLINKKPIFLNDIATLLNKDLRELCDVVSNYLKVSGRTPLQVKCNCDNCEKDMVTPSSVYLASKVHFCDKSCSNKYKKGKNFHRVIGKGKCISCEGEFDIYDNVLDQKFCCQECKKGYYREHPKYEDIVCTNCGKDYNRRYQSRDGNNYCSLDCEIEYKHNRSHEIRSCEICGGDFECFKTSTQKMCSIQCQGKWQSINLSGENANGYNHEWSIEDRTITCEWCGLEHQAKPHQIENGRRFCSDKCRQDWFAKEFSITEENIERSRIQAVKNLSDGVMNKTDTSIQLLTNKILGDLNIEYDNEYNCKYYAIDNYLNEHNLMIECQGQYWHTDPRFYKEINYEIQVNRIKIDKAKHTYIKNNHLIEILYLWEFDINNNTELCKLLVQEYVNNKGILDNYQSFNYNIVDSILTLNNELIIPYMEYDSEDIREITDTTVKEKMSHKQLDKWITFNCESCGIETEQLIGKYSINEHHYCSNECQGKANRKRFKVECNNCNKEIEVIQDKYITNKRFFCDQNCQHKYQKRVGFTKEEDRLLDIKREIRIKELALT